jgi:hypothetical protein
LKNRETPPPRKREEAKKTPESPQKKTTTTITTTTTKRSISNCKAAGDSSLPYSSYLNSLFSTSFTQLNTITPSSYSNAYQNNEKKTPISAKATPMTYNLNLSQKAQTLSRPQRTTPTTMTTNTSTTNTTQSNDNGNSNGSGYNSSLLTTTLTKPKLLYSNEQPSSLNNLNNPKYNNFISQTKNNPIKVIYEKIERPQSATPDRAVTPQSALRRLGTASTVGLNSKSINTTNGLEQRSSVPSKNSKHNKKDSNSTQELLSKYRQRSSSPSQMSTYNPVLSNSMNLKSKPKC